MRSWLVALVLVLVASAGANHDLLACGDKFLVVSRGTRFQRAPIKRLPALVLVYANPASQLPKSLANVSIETTLRKAGYQPTSVTSAAAFESALQQGGWDLVLVDIADGLAVTSRLQGQGAPVVLPVMHEPTRTQLAEAKRQYLHVLKAPAKSQSLLDAVDDALALKKQQAAKANQPTR